MDSRPGATAYLLSQMGCEDRIDREQQHLEEAARRGDAVAYFETAERDGESVGRWRGAGAAALGFEAGEAVTPEDVRTVLGELRDPTTGGQLGQALPRYETRAEKMNRWAEANPEATPEERVAEWNRVTDNHRNAVAFYDLTFSAQKSVSVYWAALAADGHHELADQVASAHRDAVDAAMCHIEEHTWTRTGGHRRTADGSTAGDFERTGNLVGVEFDHSTSRATDPHLHTHAAVLNRVQCEDGKWRAVHGAAWNKAKPAAAAVYERTLAELIEARTPARFVDRPDGMGREIAGVSAEVLAESSKRTTQVEARQQAAEQEFREKQGRAPTRREQARIHRTAGLASRDAKSHAGPAAQLEQWAQDLSVMPGDIVAEVAHTGDYMDRRGRDAEERPATREQLIRSALAQVQARGATWTAGELAAEIERQLPLSSPDADANQLAAELTSEVVAPGSTWGVVDVSRPEAVSVPEWWQTETGRPAWRDPARGRYTTRDQLGRERDLVVTARQPSHRPADDDTLARVRADLEARGLSGDQVGAVTGILGSPRAADALVSAAGTGKSFTVGQLADTWSQHRGGQVLGVATSQIATQVLAEDGLQAQNTTLFLRDYEPDPDTGLTRKSLTSDDMLVIDESNMSSTAELARLQHVATRAGAKVVYTGDPRQLQAVGAGGALGLIAKENGAHELTQVHRFTHDWERAASLRLRDGDVDALGEYEQRGRIRGGDDTEMRRQAVAGYLADTLEGKRSVLVTATNAEAADVSAETQAELGRLGKLGRQAAEQLMDGNTAHVGDLVQARRNSHAQHVTGTLSQVTNRERYRVLAVEDGRLAVETEDGTGRARLDTDYVREHLTLGYAGTEHAAEGVSVDTGHALHPGYVALTRGKERNTVYVTTRTASDEHGPGVDTNPREVLARALSADGQETAAVEQLEQETADAGNLQTLLAAWDYTGRELDGYRHGDQLLALVGAEATQRVEDSAARDGLYETLREAEARGYDTETLLTQATQRDLSDARDPAALLRWRVRQQFDTDQPQPEDRGEEGRETAADQGQDPTPASWKARTAQNQGTLGAYRQRLANQMDTRTAELGRRAGEEAPEWAVSLLGEIPADQGQRGDWEARAGQVAAWRELCGRDADPTDTGLREPPADWLHRAQYEQAATAAGLDHGETRQSDAELRAAAALGDREDAWAPEYVADQLGQAREIQQRRTAEARLARGRAVAATDPAVREREQANAARSDEVAARMDARAQLLEPLHQARQGWLRATAAVRRSAEAARAELARRGTRADQEQEQQQPATGTQAMLDIELSDLDGMSADQQRAALKRVESRDADRAEQARRQYTGTQHDRADAEPERDIPQGQTALFSVETARQGNTRLEAQTEDVRADREALETSRTAVREREPVREAQKRAEHARQILARRQAQAGEEAAEQVQQQKQQRQTQQEAGAEPTAPKRQAEARQEPADPVRVAMAAFPTRPGQRPPQERETSPSEPPAGTRRPPHAPEIERGIER